MTGPQVPHQTLINSPKESLLTLSTLAPSRTIIMQRLIIDDHALVEDPPPFQICAFLSIIFRGNKMTKIHERKIDKKYASVSFLYYVLFVLCKYLNTYIFYLVFQNSSHSGRPSSIVGSYLYLLLSSFLYLLFQ